MKKYLVLKTYLGIVLIFVFVCMLGTAQNSALANKNTNAKNGSCLKLRLLPEYPSGFV